MSIDVDEIYTKYAHRYLEIGDMHQAARDVGVPDDSVNEFLLVSQNHPDVLEILAADELEMPNFADPDSVKRHILKKLWREANYRGAGSQQSARIQALKAIGELTGIEPPKKIDLNQSSQGGMLVVPVMDAAMWEESAERMQAELKRSARE